MGREKSLHKNRMPRNMNMKRNVDNDYYGPHVVLDHAR